MFKKLFYKYFICNRRGHIFSQIQSAFWHDYYKNICKHCGYTDNVRHTSPAKITPKIDGSLEIVLTTIGSGGGGGGCGVGKQDMV